MPMSSAEDLITRIFVTVVRICDMTGIFENLRNSMQCLYQGCQKTSGSTHAPAYRSLLDIDFLVKMKTAVSPHPPYSPDLILCNFSLFPEMARHL
ncbi:hypothetical protein TNCV_1566921 [Trichonephila clavipes]|nr:hypothetical protein TNCV_1566921 [Trichonephila clavipes]